MGVGLSLNHETTCKVLHWHKDWNSGCTHSVISELLQQELQSLRKGRLRRVQGARLAEVHEGSIFPMWDALQWEGRCHCCVW